MPYEDQLKGFGFEVENPFSFLDRLRAGAIKTDNNKISTLHTILDHRHSNIVVTSQGFVHYPCVNLIEIVSILICVSTPVKSRLTNVVWKL